LGSGSLSRIQRIGARTGSCLEAKLLGSLGSFGNLGFLSGRCGSGNRLCIVNLCGVAGIRSVVSC
jgi:hypothetical protein